MVLIPWLKSFPLPGSVILSAHFPSPVCKSYGSFASAVHMYGVCFFALNEIDSFANELNTRQIERKAFAKSMRNSSFLEEQKDMLKRKRKFGSQTQAL